MPRKVILNMDPGIDDAIALLMAANSTDLDILGVVSTAGNVDVDRATRNTLRILELAGRAEVPVYRGSSAPLIKDLVTSEEIHGRDGLGDSGLGDPSTRERGVYGPKFIVNALDTESNVTIVSTGPLTNIAVAFLYSPESFANLDQLVIMGGMYGLTSYSIGNVTPYSEYNIYVDPEAFMVLYRSGIDIKAVGLDVTQDPRTYLDRDLYNEIKGLNTHVARIVSMITRRVISERGFFELHDPITLSYIIDSGVLKFRSLYISVSLDNGYSRGYIHVFRSRPPRRSEIGSVDAAYHIDAEKFIDILMDHITRR